MPKENTHLYFAHDLLGEFQGSEVLKEISEHLWHYLLGSIIPDTCYYGAHEHIRRISETFHGKEGNPTNEVIVQVLDHAGHMKDIAFILGYISHCALDITFHPVVYYLSGNYYDESPEKRNHAVYLHRHLETCLDIDLGNTLRLHRIIRTQYLRGLAFEKVVSEQFQVPVTSLSKTLRRQILSNLFFSSTAAYAVARASSRLGLLRDSPQLGLFYADADHGERIPSVIKVADLLDGHKKIITLKELFQHARTSAKSMMEAAYGYWKKGISREELLLAIPGLSLDTGVLGMSARDIRYTRDMT